MSQDTIVQRLDQVERARRDLVEELERLGSALAQTRTMRGADAPVSKILQRGPGPEARRRVRRRVVALTGALHAYRAELIRTLVDEEGWSIAEVARTTRNARQVVSRLYHAAM